MSLHVKVKSAYPHVDWVKHSYMFFLSLVQLTTSILHDYVEKYINYHQFTQNVGYCCHKLKRHLERFPLLTFIQNLLKPEFVRS